LTQHFNGPKSEKRSYFPGPGISLAAFIEKWMSRTSSLLLPILALGALERVDVNSKPMLDKGEYLPGPGDGRLS